MRKRKVKNFRKYVLIALVALIVGGVGVLSWGKWDTQYPSVINSPKIPYKHLSNEDIEPYLWYGKVPVIRQGTGRLNDYVRTAGEIRDVRQCLVRSEQEKPEPDLRLIDWKRVSGVWFSYTRIDVCLFRIFSSIGTIDGVVRWMQYHRMETKVRPKYENHSYWLDSDDPREELYTRTVYGVYRTDKHGRGLVPPSFIPRFLAMVFFWMPPLYSEGISSNWDENNKLMSVDYGGSRL